MITASKMISFNDGVAESLTIRVGEKNRQFKFSPDIDINDYDVKMVIIKPDNTFTITDCSIDDGFIIAAIPEQAAAVPGLGGYNIRVYDNDTNIYSAAGGVWVDDSLLLDELIESVAEVNGYVFPDDFFTTGDIEANPSGAAADALDKIRIFDTIYSIEGTEPELSLDDLTDVTITDPDNGEVLTRSGNNWINAALPDLPPVSKTASGNPVEFDDGADAPLVKCVSEITGSQDLHGQDKPWVGGAGKNKLPLVLADIKSANTGGTWSGNTYTRNGLTFTIETDGDDNVTGIKVNGTANAVTYFLVVSNLTSLGTFDGTYVVNGGIDGGSDSTFALQVYSDVTNIFINAYNANDYEIVSSSAPTANISSAYITIRNGYTANNLLFKPMIRLATETDSTFAPYSNICPITAYTEGEIEVSDGDGNVTTHTTTYPSAIYRGSEDCVEGELTTEWGIIASYAGETLPGEWISDRDEYAPGTTPTIGAQVAYELDTPTTSSVTSTNLPVKSLSGYNNIESSTGDMEVEYITKHYEPIIKAAEILAQS